MVVSVAPWRSRVTGTHWDTIWVLLSDALSFSLALLCYEGKELLSGLVAMNTPRTGHEPNGCSSLNLDLIVAGGSGGKDLRWVEGGGGIRGRVMKQQPRAVYKAKQ